MPAHEKKQCSRCKIIFECKSGSINLCQCSKVSLTPEQLEYISLKYSDCLCRGCLEQCQAEVNEQ